MNLATTCHAHRTLRTPPHAVSFALTRWIDVGDLNGDGSPDVVVAFQTTFQLTWFSNLDGLGEFSVGIDIDTYEDGDQSRYVKVADLDGDGDLDVITASKQGGKRASYFDSR